MQVFDVMVKLPTNTITKYLQLLYDKAHDLLGNLTNDLELEYFIHGLRGYYIHLADAGSPLSER